MLLRPSLDVQWPDFVTHIVRFALVFVIADLSYRYLELPVRSGAIGRTLNSWRISGIPRPTSFVSISAIAGAAILLVASVNVFMAPMPSAANTAAFGGITSIDEDPTPVAIPTVTPVPQSTEIQPPKPAPSIVPKPTVVFGDSVMLGSREQLLAVLGKVAIDAAVGRQPSVIAQRINIRRSENRLGEDVVIHMGTNGIVTQHDLKPILDSLADRRRVVVINVQVPRVWMDPSNKTINSLAAQYPNVRLVDWYHSSKGHRNYFVADGVHLTFTGATVMANLIKTALNEP